MKVPTLSMARSIQYLLAGLLLIAAFGVASPAVAKGPISAIITGPGIDEPIELIGDARQQTPKLVTRLMEQTGLWYGTGDLPRPLDGGPPPDLGTAYTLTWVNGGPPGASVAARTIVQRIYLDAPNGPVIHTPVQPSLDNWGPGVVGWFAAPVGLPETLAELGVPIRSTISLPNRVFAALAELMGLPGRASTELIDFLGVVTIFMLIAVAGALLAWRGRRSPQRPPPAG